MLVYRCGVIVKISHSTDKDPTWTDESGGAN